MADLTRKLGLQPGHRVCLLDATPDTSKILRAAIPGGVAPDVAPGPGRYDQIYLWLRSLDGIVARLNQLIWKIDPDGALWIVIPKAAFARRRGLDITWGAMQAAALETDLVDNKVASLTEEEYATRFVIRKDRREGYRQTESEE